MNEHELESMRKVFNNLRRKIEPLSESPKILNLRERVTKIRKDSIDNNEELLQTARQSFKENDIDLFYAEDDKQARDIEINASEFLEENGMVIVDTDLGDRILQLKKGDNSPVHPTGPASHLTVQDIADIINESMGLDLPAVPRPIMEAVREDVLSLLSKSYIGISGTNAIAAEDGAFVMVHNEGNISIVQSKKLHIVVAGIEKLVPTIEDCVSIAKLETAYATGKTTTSYMNIVSGPSKTADIEKKLLKNMYGAEKVALILLDNGRKEAYLGGRGIALAKYLKGDEASVDSGLYMCTLCGICTENCPVATPTNEMIENLRDTTQKDGFAREEHKKIRDNINESGSPY